MKTGANCSPGQGHRQQGQEASRGRHEGRLQEGKFSYTPRGIHVLTLRQVSLLVGQAPRIQHGASQGFNPPLHSRVSPAGDILVRRSWHLVLISIHAAPWKGPSWFGFRAFVTCYVLLGVAGNILTVTCVFCRLLSMFCFGTGTGLACCVSDRRLVWPETVSRLSFLSRWVGIMSLFGNLQACATGLLHLFMLTLPLGRRALSTLLFSRLH